MKIAVLLAAAALACGTAFAAQEHSVSSDRDAASSRAAVTGEHKGKVARGDTATKAADGDGIVDKTKRAFRRMGDKVRSATSRGADRDRQQASNSDTRSMGAAGSAGDDSARRQRMDDAYENWKAKQK